MYYSPCYIKQHHTLKNLLLILLSQISYSISLKFYLKLVKKNVHLLSFLLTPTLLTLHSSIFYFSTETY